MTYWTLLLLALGPTSSDPAWSDVRPVVERSCARCHYGSGPGGFALLEPKHFRPRRRQLERVLRSGEMPPWLPRGATPKFTGDRRLSASDKQLLLDWLEAGTPGIGEPRVEAAEAPRSAWQLGPPDLVLRTSTFEVPATGEDVFRNLIAPAASLQRPAWVRAVELRPSSEQAVHHVVLTVDETPSSRRLDEADPEPGFSGMDGASRARSPGGTFIGWTPGKSPDPGHPDVAWLLRPGADLVALLHLLPSGSARSVSLEIGLHFAEQAPTRQSVPLRLGSMSLEIAERGTTPVVVHDRFELPVTATLASVYPHAHYLAQRLEAWALLPSGERRPLLEIPAWDFHWQDQYRLETPWLLPAGSVLEMRYTYGSPEPPRTVTFGPSSLDEMADLWLELFASSSEERETLQRAARDHQLLNAEAGLRHELSRSRDVRTRADAQFRLASNLLKQGREQEAVRGFEAVLELDQKHLGALTNFGNLLIERGEGARALDLLERAVKLFPESTDAHFNLANAHLASGSTERALEIYDQILDRTPSRDGAWLNRGIALHRSGRTSEALASFRRATELEPANVAAWVNLAWLLLEAGEPAEARGAYERARELLPEDPRLDPLARAIE